MTKPICNYGPRMRKALVRVGVTAPDTAFNRRAKEYARGARYLKQAAQRREQSAKAKPAPENVG
jgi:hypothetical protein